MQINSQLLQDVWLASKSRQNYPPERGPLSAPSSEAWSVRMNLQGCSFTFYTGCRYFLIYSLRTYFLPPDLTHESLSPNSWLTGGRGVCHNTLPTMRSTFEGDIVEVTFQVWAPTNPVGGKKRHWRVNSTENLGVVYASCFRAFASVPSK